jgi:hypothetical protein
VVELQRRHRRLGRCRECAQSQRAQTRS